MAPFIATAILDASEVSIEKGKELYRAYFINTKMWARYKEQVDTILRVEGKADCIVTE
jgi:hypothetical protein